MAEERKDVKAAVLALFGDTKQKTPPLDKKEFLRGFLETRRIPKKMLDDFKNSNENHLVQIVARNVANYIAEGSVRNNIIRQFQ